MKCLLDLADRSEELKGFVHPGDAKKARIPIFSGSRLVGFASPRMDPDGVWRMGAIFIHPDQRGKGLAASAIGKFMAGKKGRAFIETANLASQRAYEKAGFRLIKEEPAKAGAWWENF